MPWLATPTVRWPRSLIAYFLTSSRTMPSKNDLSMFKKVEPDNSVKPSEPKSILAPKTTGRRPKKPADKESEVVAIKLTPAELAKLEDKAGLVPKSTYLKHILRTETDIFE